MEDTVTKVNDTEADVTTPIVKRWTISEAKALKKKQEQDKADFIAKKDKERDDEVAVCDAEIAKTQALIDALVAAGLKE